jgi:hypothetical protein
MMNQPLFETYLIKPKNQSFVTGKALLPASLVFPEGILKIHKLIITINIILLIVTPFVVNEWVLSLTSLADNSNTSSYFFSFRRTGNAIDIVNPISVLAMILDVSIFWLFLVNYERWLAKRILSKGARIIEGWIYDVRFITLSESDETEILFELPTPNGDSIKGKLRCELRRRTQPVVGNTLKFLYLNRHCYFFL